MLKQESITAVSKAPTAPAAIVCELLAGTDRLIKEIQQRFLAGESINNRTLTELPTKCIAAAARGIHTARDAYNRNRSQQGTRNEGKRVELMTMSVSGALSQTLRPLTERLPRQADRTRAQVPFQHF